MSESCREWISWTLKSKWRAMQSENMSFPKDNSALTRSFGTTFRECLINILKIFQISQSKWQLYKGHIFRPFSERKTILWRIFSYYCRPVFYHVTTLWRFLWILVSWTLKQKRGQSSMILFMILNEFGQVLSFEFVKTTAFSSIENHFKSLETSLGNAVKLIVLDNCCYPDMHTIQSYLFVFKA